jgi:hypothetical protein
MLPARLVADACALADKCSASRAWGTKPANAGLQFRNLVSVEREGHLCHAYQTVGAYALLDERRLKSGRSGCFEFVLYVGHASLGLITPPVVTPNTLAPRLGRAFAHSPMNFAIACLYFYMRPAALAFLRAQRKFLLCAANVCANDPHAHGTVWRCPAITVAPEPEPFLAQEGSEGAAVPDRGELVNLFGFMNGANPPVDSRVHRASATDPPLPEATISALNSLFQNRGDSVDRCSDYDEETLYEYLSPEDAALFPADADITPAILAQPTSEAYLESAAPAAELAVVIDEQQGAYVNGTTLQGKSVHNYGCPKSGPKVKGRNGTPDHPGEDVGLREASARFPNMSQVELHLFNNDPVNLESANTLRNVGVGVHKPSADEAKARDKIVQFCKDRVFTRKQCTKSMIKFESVHATALPKKLSEAEKAQWQLDAMNDAEGSGLSYSRYVDAFVKSEVSAKPKPRPIANHGKSRLCALAKVAWVFDDVLFNVLQKMSIKHRTKREVMRDIAREMNEMRDGAKWGENDLTAFEFGISEELKAAEAGILSHIAGLIGVEDVGSLLFERVVGDRTEPIVWKMRYKDEFGVMKTFKLTQERCMRESGDRLTSSGNFFQNFLAWMSFLIWHEDVDAALNTLLTTKGAKFFYISARDPKRGTDAAKKYRATLAFEGDDTLCRMQEPIWEPVHPKSNLSHIDDFFFRWGWSPKLTWKKEVGYDSVRFVGYDFLLHNNKAVDVGGELICCPEIARILNTKQWTTFVGTPDEKKMCLKVYALVMAQEFVNMAPMYYFFESLYEENKQAKAIVCDTRVRELSLLVNGVLPEYGSDDFVKGLNDGVFPEFQGGNFEWMELARSSAGTFTEREWATACAAPPLDVHGLDLALHFPASWTGRASLAAPPGL